jgi:hypothetical protein
VLDPKDPTTWTFQLAMTWKGEPDESLDNAGRMAALKLKSTHMAEPWRSAFHWIPDGTPTPCDKNYYWVPVPWDNHNGRVTLAGDAAHPMLPCTSPIESAEISTNTKPRRSRSRTQPLHMRCITIRQCTCRNAS